MKVVRNEGSLRDWQQISKPRQFTSMFVREDIHFSEYIMEKLPKYLLIFQSGPRHGIKFKNFNTTFLVGLSL